MSGLLYLLCAMFVVFGSMASIGFFYLGLSDED